LPPDSIGSFGLLEAWLATDRSPLWQAAECAE
jgi:hypothetical protein